MWCVWLLGTIGSMEQNLDLELLTFICLKRTNKIHKCLIVEVGGRNQSFYWWRPIQEPCNCPVEAVILNRQIWFLYLIVSSQLFQAADTFLEFCLPEILDAVMERNSNIFNNNYYCYYFSGHDTWEIQRPISCCWESSCLQLDLYILFYFGETCSQFGLSTSIFSGMHYPRCFFGIVSFRL